LFVTIGGTANYNGTYTVTTIDANSFYFSKAYISTETGTFTTKIIPSDVGTSGYQIRLAGLSEIAVANLGLDSNTKIRIDIASFGWAKKTTASTNSYVFLRNASNVGISMYAISGRSPTSYFEVIIPDSSITDKKYSTAFMSTEITKINETYYLYSCKQRGSSSSDKSKNCVALTSDFGAEIILLENKSIDRFLIGSNNPLVALYRNGLIINVWRIN
jgi:hypothetical protein